MQKAYILTTASVTDIEPNVLPSERIELASATKARGKVPAVPALENQKDLTKLVSILVSTGINRNDDVFLPGEILPVRNTGAHKPVNMEHDPTQIIGHMLRTFASEKDGKVVADNKKPSGKTFDITSEAVLYSFLFPDLVEDIKERAESNNLFVSVEVWFTAFDYLVGNKIVKRNAATASQFEGTLKVNGGTGFFEGKRVGRVLRNMIIGGIGIVKDPANPESIIKSVSNLDSEVVNEIEDESISGHIIGDINDPSEHEEEQTDGYMEVIMDEKILEEMAVLASANKAVAESHDNEEALDIDTEGASAELQAIATRLAVVEKTNRELAARADQAEFESAVARRASNLREAGIPEEMLERHLTRCFRMTEDQFEEYSALLVDTLNSIGLDRAEASAVAEEVETEETTETVEGGDDATAENNDEVTSEVEETTSEVEEDTTEVVETEEVVDDASQLEQESETVEVDEEIEVDIELVDPDINTEGNSADGQPSLTDQMADIVQQFLGQKNDKWKKLALKD